MGGRIGRMHWGNYNVMHNCITVSIHIKLFMHFICHYMHLLDPAVGGIVSVPVDILTNVPESELKINLW